MKHIVQFILLLIMETIKKIENVIKKYNKTNIENKKKTKYILLYTVRSNHRQALHKIKGR